MVLKLDFAVLKIEWLAIRVIWFEQQVRTLIITCENYAALHELSAFSQHFALDAVAVLVVV